MVEPSGVEKEEVVGLGKSSCLFSSRSTGLTVVGVTERPKKSVILRVGLLLVEVVVEELEVAEAEGRAERIGLSLTFPESSFP